MKNIIRSMLITASALLVVTACTDPTVAPKSSVSSANIFSEEASYKAFLAKLYAGLATSGQQGPAGNGDISGLDEGFAQYMRLWWQMEELPTDEAAVAWNDGPIQELNTQIWASSNSFLGSMYYRIYFQVGLVNEFLRETTESKLSERGVSAAMRAEITKYRAEARFLRARAVRGLGARATPSQRDNAEEDLAAAYAMLDGLAANGRLAADRQPLWARVKVAHLR